MDKLLSTATTTTTTTAARKKKSSGSSDNQQPAKQARTEGEEEELSKRPRKPVEEEEEEDDDDKPRPIKRARKPVITVVDDDDEDNTTIPTTTATTTQKQQPRKPTTKPPKLDLPPKWPLFKSFLETMSEDVIFAAIDVVKGIGLECNTQQQISTGIHEAIPLIQYAADAHYIGILQNDGTFTNLTFTKNSKERMAAYRAMQGDDEPKVYEELVKQGKEGMSLVALKRKLASAYPQSKVDAMVKSLEQKGLIKKFVNILRKNTKYYILASLVPDRNLSGEPWYWQGEFDSEFVRMVKTATLEVVERLQYLVRRTPKLGVTAKEVHAEIIGLPQFTVNPERIANLEVGDVNKVLHEEFHEGDLILLKDGQKTEYFTRGREQVYEEYTLLPCFDCPYFQQCGSSLASKYNPLTCDYMDSFWMNGYKKMIEEGEQLSSSS